ncbi:MAG TPA: hypothetical protein VF222_09125 [Nitrososphaeraceae archaeon]
MIRITGKMTVKPLSPLYIWVHIISSAVANGVPGFGPVLRVINRERPNTGQVR